MQKFEASARKAGLLPPKPSKSARNKARLAKQLAGGVTEWMLYTPVPLPISTTRRGFKRREGDHLWDHDLTDGGVEMKAQQSGPTTRLRPALHRATTAQAVLHQADNPPSNASQPRPWHQAGHLARPGYGHKHGLASEQEPTEQVMHTISFLAVKDRLYALRYHLRQCDNAGGDLSLLTSSAILEDMNHHPEPAAAFPSEVQEQAGAQQDRIDPASPNDRDTRDLHVPSPLRDKHRQQSYSSRAPSDLLHLDGDLALPPPALDIQKAANTHDQSEIHATTSQAASTSPVASRRRRSSMISALSMSGSAITRRMRSKTITSSNGSVSKAGRVVQTKEGRAAGISGQRDHTDRFDLSANESKTGWHMSDVPLTPSAWWQESSDLWNTLEHTGQQDVPAERHHSNGPDAMDRDLSELRRRRVAPMGLEERLRAGMKMGRQNSQDAAKNGALRPKLALSGLSSSAKTDVQCSPENDESAPAGATFASLNKSSPRYGPAESKGQLPHLESVFPTEPGKGLFDSLLVENLKADEDAPLHHSQTLARPSSGDETSHSRPSVGAWWLDVKCPTYSDMKDLSKLFPLHPLTVEDILQQDPREKVEVFEKLGYYFVAVRALDETFFRIRSAHDDGSTPRIDLLSGVPGKDGIEGVSVGAINLYLVVFTHGLITFHFEDLSVHTSRALKRLTDLSPTMNVTADWIAHGLMDSLVDTFFPILTLIEAEVAEFEDTVELHPDSTKPEEELRAAAWRQLFAGKRRNVLPRKKSYRWPPDLKGGVAMAKKRANLLSTVKLIVRRINVSFRQARGPLLFQHHENIEEIELDQIGAEKKTKDEPSTSAGNDQTALLRRMATVRKIVTGLTRLLAPKSESVLSLRKRYMELGAMSLGSTRASRIEVSIHMGDLHDHIITLLTQLHQSDNRLNDTYADYLSVVQIRNRQSRQRADRSLVGLVTVTVTAVLCTFFTSLWSFNVKIPMNEHGSGDHLVFALIVATLCVITAVLQVYVRHLWTQADRRRADRSAHR